MRVFRNNSHGSTTVNPYVTDGCGHILAALELKDRLVFLHTLVHTNLPKDVYVATFPFSNTDIIWKEYTCNEIAEVS